MGIHEYNEAASSSISLIQLTKCYTILSLISKIIHIHAPSKIPIHDFGVYCSQPLDMRVTRCGQCTIPVTISRQTGQFVDPHKPNEYLVTISQVKSQAFQCFNNPDPNSTNWLRGKTIPFSSGENNSLFHTYSLSLLLKNAPSLREMGLKRNSGRPASQKEKFHIFQSFRSGVGIRLSKAPYLYETSNSFLLGYHCSHTAAALVFTSSLLFSWKVTVSSDAQCKLGTFSGRHPPIIQGIWKLSPDRKMLFCQRTWHTLFQFLFLAFHACAN